MVNTPSLFTAGVLASTLASVQVDAHGALKVPLGEGLPGKTPINWVLKLTPAWPWEGSGSWKGGDQAGQFAKLSKKNGFSTLRSFLEDKGPACGNSNPNVTPRPVPSTNYAEFLGNEGGGFTHQGPCEIWLDDKRVFQHDNCEKGYPTKGKDAVKLPVDYSSCTGKCMLRFYWLGFQNEEWQVYKDCIPLQRQGGTSSTPKATPAATPKVTPNATPKPTPKVTPEAASEATPNATSNATPKATPNTTPKATPQATPQATPKATPQATPQPSSRPKCSKRRLGA